jgi:hypothetical protein
MTSPNNPNSGGLPMTGPLIGQFTEQKVYEGSPGEQDAVAVPSQTRENYAMQLLRRHAVASERLARIAFDKTHPVDEYISTPGVPAQNPIVIQPTYWMPERIDSVLACIPAGVTSALLQLGDRYIELITEQAQQTSIAQGSATPTVASQGITTLPAVDLPAGLYNVTIQTYLDGTVTAADEDNFKLVWNGTSVSVLDNPAVADELTTTTLELELNGINSLIVQTHNAPSGTAVYHAVITASPVEQPGTGSATLINLNGLGIIINQDDNRTLTLTPIPPTGPVHIELMGYADEIYGNA